MKLQFAQQPGYLEARIDGIERLEHYLAAFRQVADEAARLGARRLYLDLATVGVDLPDLDRFELGREAAALFRQVDRVAVLMHPRARYTGFAIDAANNRGLEVQAYFTAGDALGWLAQS